LYATRRGRISGSSPGRLFYFFGRDSGGASLLMVTQFRQSCEVSRDVPE